MRYLIIESATGDELGSIDTDADAAVEDLIEAGWLDGEIEDYEADEDHPMAGDGYGDIVIVGPDFPELVLEPDEEYDEEDEEDDEDDS